VPPKKRAKKATKLEMAQRLVNAVTQKIHQQFIRRMIHHQ
jgi:hypothetical protein